MKLNDGDQVKFSSGFAKDMSFLAKVEVEEFDTFFEVVSKVCINNEHCGLLLSHLNA